jgi:thiamine pyrophosphate-dependent acetolactate synthase large subunit-like protein
VDIEPEEFHNSIETAVPLCGDIDAVSGQLVEAFKQNKWSFGKSSSWWEAINAKIENNRKTVTVRA